MSLGLFIPFILTWVAQRMLEYLVHHDSSNCTCWFYARIQDSIVNHSKETTDGLLILSVARSEIVGFSSIFFGRLNPFVFLIEPLFSQHDSQQEVGQGSEYNSRIQATLLWSGKNLENKRKERERDLMVFTRNLTPIRALVSDNKWGTDDEMSQGYDLRGWHEPLHWYRRSYTNAASGRWLRSQGMEMSTKDLGRLDTTILKCVLVDDSQMHP